MSLSTPAYLKEQKLSGDIKSIDKIREEFKKYGIKVSYSPDEKNRRVIFSATKQQRQVSSYDKFVSECNGLVLQSETWKPLVIPPRTFKSNVQVDVINRGIARNEYDIFEATDGTMVNLYYYASSWRLSTAKGFDVTYLKWNGKIYNQILKEVLRTCAIDIGAFYEALDKGRCYTFCFTHPSFHPFWKTRENPIRIVFIQSADLATEQSSTKNPFDNIPSQKKVSGIKNIRDLFKILPKTLEEYSSKGTVNFGYILRLRDTVDTSSISDESLAYSHVFLESRLLQTIRNLYYNGQHTMAARDKKFDLETYIVVNSFLDKKVNARFVQLFPQYAPHFEKLEAISIKLIAKMISIISQETPDQTDLESKSADLDTTSAEFLVNELNKVYTVDVRSRDSTRIVSSFILNTDYVDIFYALHNQSENSEPCTSTLDGIANLEINSQ